MPLNAFFFNTPIEDTYIGHQAAEIFKDNVYGKYLVGKKDLVIMDLGGNLGLASYYFSKFAKVVYTFEPAQEHYEVLTKQLEFNKLTNVIPFKLAISNEDGESIFYHLQNKTMYSLRPAGIDATQQHEKVKTVRLDTFFKENNIEHVDFMKLDIEGSEGDILCGDGFQNIGDKIDVLFMEIHSWLGRNPEQLKDALKAVGFKNIEVIPNDAIIWVATR